MPTSLSIKAKLKRKEIIFLSFRSFFKFFFKDVHLFQRKFKYLLLLKFEMLELGYQNVDTPLSVHSVYSQCDVADDNTTTCQLE